VVTGTEYTVEPDPFDEFSSLFDLDALDFGDEGPINGLAREGQEGDWDAEVDAVEVATDHGRVILEAGRAIEVRVGPKIVDKRPATGGRASGWAAPGSRGPA
jgi:hypothetical protein